MTDSLPKMVNGFQDKKVGIGRRGRGEGEDGVFGGLRSGGGAQQTAVKKKKKETI